MKKVFFFTLSLILGQTAIAQVQRNEIGNLLTEGIPDLPARLTSILDQYQNTRTASFSDWTADGKGMYISTRFGDVPQIHLVEGPGMARRQITFFKEPITSASACPDKTKAGFLFAKDTGGDENYQLFYFDLKTGQYQLLTDGKSRNEGAHWNKKGDKFAFRSNKRSGKDFDFYLSNTTDPTQANMILQLEGGGWRIVDWSDNDKRLLVQNYVSVNESRLYLLDVATAKLTQLHPADKKIAYGEAVFSKDGIFLVSDENTEFAQLRYYDLATQQLTNITAAIPWDVEGLSLNDQGTTLAFSTNEGGFSKLYLLDTQTKKYRPASNLPPGVIGSFDFAPDGLRLAITMNTSTTPSDVFVVNTAADAIERWTFSEVGGLNTANFVEPRLIQYPTFDSLNGKSRQIPAFVYLPKKVQGKVPVVISIHGGPEGQSLPSFNPTIQYMVNELGVAVLVPNVRGSSGYGKTYLQLDNGFLRENSVKDIGTLLDWIGRQPNLDAGRVSVFGGSYGGYMVLASMTMFNDRLRAGIDLFGISNWLTFLKNTSEYRRDLRRVEYGDEREPKMNEFLARISPIQKVNNITKPMFIFQGVNDPRVPVTESEQMLAALKKNGTPTWYVQAKDEGHGIAKKANRDYTYAAIMLFMENYLLKEKMKIDISR